jgi:hypothetical protein
MNDMGWFESKEDVMMHIGEQLDKKTRKSAKEEGRKVTGTCEL